MFGKLLRPALIIGTLPVTLTNGTTADATQVMSDLNWIVNQVNANAAALATTALTNANNNFTVVQSGTAASAAANFPIASQVQNNVFNTLSSTLGTNTLTARIAALPLGAFVAGQVFSFIPSQTNTGAVGITIDAAGSSSIFFRGASLLGSELAANVPAVLIRDSSKLNLLERAPKPPVTVTLTAGSGTWVPPAGWLYLDAQLWGGGGGGAGGGAGSSNGSDTTFGALTASGGVKSGGAVGAGSGGDINLSGCSGGTTDNVVSGASGVPGRVGGAAPMMGLFGNGGEASGGAGKAAPVNSGGGGGGGGGVATVGGGNAGGSGGGYCRKRITTQAASFAYGVGAKGSGDTGGAGSGAGGDGGSGLIVLDIYFG